MRKCEVLGEEILVCTTEEAKEIWRAQPGNRSKLWTEDEVTAYLLTSPEEIAAAIQQKRAKPGKLKIAERSDIPAEELPNCCAERRVWCSERVDDYPEGCEKGGCK